MTGYRLVWEVRLERDWAQSGYSYGNPVVASAVGSSPEEAQRGLTEALEAAKEENRRQKEAAWAAIQAKSGPVSG